MRRGKPGENSLEMRKRAVTAISRKQAKMLRTRHDSCNDSTGNSYSNSDNEPSEQGSDVVISSPRQSDKINSPPTSMNINDEEVTAGFSTRRMNTTSSFSPSKQIRLESSLTLSKKQSEEYIKQIKKENIISIPGSSIISLKTQHLLSSEKESSLLELDTVQKDSYLPVDISSCEFQDDHSEKDTRTLSEINKVQENDCTLLELDSVQKDSYLPVDDISSCEFQDNHSEKDTRTLSEINNVQENYYLSVDGICKPRDDDSEKESGILNKTDKSREDYCLPVDYVDTPKPKTCAGGSDATNRVNEDFCSTGDNDKENVVPGNSLAYEVLCEVTGKIKYVLPEIPHTNATEEIEKIESSDKNKHRKRKLPSLCHKSYIDFKSDEEDFSDGSSDLWSVNESESENELFLSPDKKNKTKRRKKKKTKSPEIKIKERIKLSNKSKFRKSQKDAGKNYETRTGTYKPEKSMKENPCKSDKCARQCYEIPEERRQAIFNYFWSLDTQRRRDWIVRCVHKTDIKRKKTKNDHSRRSCSYEYVINEGEGYRKVCQQFLLQTLDITQKYILYTISNSNEGMAKNDGRHSNVPIKYDDESKNNVKKFIEKLPAVPSHYCRKNITRLYLPQEFKNVTNLYRIYSVECVKNSETKVPEKMFIDIFKNNYNIGFHVPKKDKCVTCLKAENNEVMTEEDKINLKIHLEEKVACYKRFKVHQSLNSHDTLTVSFDLQKILNTPHGSSMLLYYARKYAVFNLTFYESTTQNGHCYVWGEAHGKRGGFEIASCIYQYLELVDERAKIKHVLLYCDSCYGQNKNKTVLTALHQFLKVSKNIETIQINYLLPGHTYMPVDSMHSVIEKEVKKLIVYSPSEWPTYMQSARKNPRPYKVNVLEFSDFKDWQPLITKTFTPSTLNQFQISKLRIVTFKKKELKKMNIKLSMLENAEVITVPLSVQSRKTGKGKGKGRINKEKSLDTEELQRDDLDNIILQPLYQDRLPISTIKYKDLNDLCQKLIIPKRFHAEYTSLPKIKKQDTLQSTDEEDESDCND